MRSSPGGQRGQHCLPSSSSASSSYASASSAYPTSSSYASASSSYPTSSSSTFVPGEQLSKNHGKESDPTPKWAANKMPIKSALKTIGRFVDEERRGDTVGKGEVRRGEKEEYTSRGALEMVPRKSGGKIICRGKWWWEVQRGERGR